MPAALVQGLVDVGRMGYLFLGAHSADIHQSKGILCHSEPLTDAFQSGFPSFNEQFLCQNFKSNYINVVPYSDHGAERVKNHTPVNQQFTQDIKVPMNPFSAKT